MSSLLSLLPSSLRHFFLSPHSSLSLPSCLAFLVHSLTLYPHSMATTPVNSGPGKATLKVSSGAAVNQQAAGGCC